MAYVQVQTDSNEPYVFQGLSTDTKPTTWNGGDVKPLSMFIESDTGNIYQYDTVNTNPTTSDGWWPLP